MALLLSDVVIRGQINNRTRNSVHGWIQLRGFDRPLLLNLTGNCSDDLFGTCFSFEANDSVSLASANPVTLSQLVPHQIGPAGTMTSLGRVQVANCSAEALLQLAESGLQPPIEWKSSLFLEWFSQNGRVIVELLDSCITFNDIPVNEPDIAIDDDDSLMDEESSQFGEDGEEDDPYGLFPKDLDQQISADLESERDSFDPLDDLDMDVVPLLQGEDVPLQLLFDPPLKLFPAESLSDRQIKESWQVLLARLAQHGVALDMCEHFSLRDAYCLLLEHILPEESVPAQLGESGFIQHYTTHEFCSVCLSQFLLDEPLDDAQQDASSDEETL